MDEEIRTIFEEALEEEPLRSDPADEARDRAILDYAVSAAVGGSGTRDPEVLEMLLRSREISVENGAVTGLEEALAELRRDKPFLFADGGDRPRFAAAACGRSLSAEDAAVAQRYKNNHWYRG